jgi:hypothetical protein
LPSPMFQPDPRHRSWLEPANQDPGATVRMGQQGMVKIVGSTNVYHQKCVYYGI